MSTQRATWKVTHQQTDICTLLNAGSSHPNNCEGSVIYSQALHYRKIITDNNVLEIQLTKLKENLLKRGYGIRDINNEFQKIANFTQSDILYKKKHDKPNHNILPFIIPYDQTNKLTGPILRKRFHRTHHCAYPIPNSAHRKHFQTSPNLKPRWNLLLFYCNFLIISMYHAPCTFTHWTIWLWTATFTPIKLPPSTNQYDSTSSNSNQQHHPASRNQLSISSDSKCSSECCGAYEKWVYRS